MNDDLVRVRSILDRVGLRGTTIDAPPHRGFSGARVWRANVADGRTVAVRAWPRDELPIARLRGLHRLLQHVADTGIVEVAAPLTDARGETLFRVDGDIWQVEPWLRGTPRLVSEPSHSRVRAASGLLARWHAATRSFAARAEESRWFSVSPSSPSSAVRDRMDRIEVWVGGRCEEARRALTGRNDPFGELAGAALDGFARHAAPLRRMLECFAGDAFPTQPCLRDVHAGHVLFAGERPTGVIDPSACRSDSVAVDLARLVGDVDPFDESLVVAGEKGYRSCGPLGSREADLIRVLIRAAVVLTPTTWIGRYCFGSRSFQPDGRVLDRLRRCVERLGRL